MRISMQYDINYNRTRMRYMYFAEYMSVQCTYPTLQIILDLSIPEKELAKTRSQILFIYFQSHS